MKVQFSKSENDIPENEDNWKSFTAELTLFLVPPDIDSVLLGITLEIVLAEADEEDVTVDAPIDFLFALKTFLDVSILFSMLSSTYPSATLLERQPPCLLSDCSSAPLFARIVADVLPMQ